MPLVDVALGAALVAIRQLFPRPPEKFDTEQHSAAMETAQKAAAYGMELAKKLAVEQSRAFAAGLR